MPLLPCYVVVVCFLLEPMFKSLHSGYSACVASVVQTPICHIGFSKCNYDLAMSRESDWSGKKFQVVEACSRCHMLHGCRERA